jgi:hypothetical protein
VGAIVDEWPLIIYDFPSGLNGVYPVSIAQTGANTKNIFNTYNLQGDRPPRKRGAQVSDLKIILKAVECEFQL